MSHFRPAPSDDALFYVELRRAPRAAADAPLPDWLDLVLCIAAPTLLAAVIVALSRLPAALG